jgi:UDP-3-O-[3-hydroxymyristoyl] glucosamine N-acyltransferase
MGAGGGFTLGELAEALRAALDGDPDRRVTGVAPLETAGPDDISFLTDTRYAAAARASRAGALLVGPDARDVPAPTLRCAAPQVALVTLLELFHPPTATPPGVHPTAVVAADARLDPTAWVGALAVIESGAAIGPRARLYPLVYVGQSSEIGADSVLYPHVVVRERVRLGQRVLVHPGAVLGADGFGFVHDGAGHRKIPQVGGVRIEDDVEIGANTTIDRATFGDTIVRRGTKIDNLVQIGHNVEVGEHAILVAQVGVSGSSRLGRGVVLGGQVGISDHVTVGEGASVGAQSGVGSDLEAGGRYFGYPARPAAKAMRIVAAEERLPELLKRVRALERRVAELEAGRGRNEAAR